MAQARRDPRAVWARAIGGAAGLGAVLTAAAHYALGEREVRETLATAQGDLPPAYLAQAYAAWLGVVFLVGLIGLGLALAALRRTGWLYSLGGAAAVAFAGLAALYMYAAGEWGAPGLPPQAALLLLIAALSGGAAQLAGPRR
jgi:hypothetical protein